MPAVGMNHFTVLSDDLERSRDFYMTVLGLQEGHRPPLGFPGAWLYCDGQAVLHIIAGRKLPEPRAGVLDHMAFSAKDLKGTVEKLRSRGVPYELRRQDESGTWQLFCFDPSGAKVELDFPPSEPAPD
ncbi:MAG TPA: VOC family protein [Burkholderiales bacterium]|jgi:catechol 2,3-dioxygenase-like lactoylglutathione lyase family enzyme|nr:VOC family protein [Burkholderiales bacterium]